MSAVFPIEDDPRYRIITASAGQTAFAVAFPFQSAGDVKAFEEDAGEWVEIDDAGYTVTGAGNPSGGTLTFTAGRTGGERILILGLAVLERLTSIVLNGRFSSRATDDELDRNRLIQQELKREIDRAVKASYGETAPTIDLSVPDGSVLIKNGLRLEAGPSSDQISAAQGYAEDAIAAAADALAAANQALAAAAAAAASAASIALPSPAGAGNAGKVLQSSGSAWILDVLAIAQVSGLADALAAKLALAGGVMTGNLAIHKATAQIRLALANGTLPWDIRYDSTTLSFYYNNTQVLRIGQDGNINATVLGDWLSTILGNKAATSQLFGVGQTWQDVTASRAAATWYQNSGSRSIDVCISSASSGGTTRVKCGASIGSAAPVGITGAAGNYSTTVTFAVPPGGYYGLDGPASISLWSEMK
ncbi:hypothetical protein [Rhizobium straminoryzae]|uniref:Tail fiber protein n=1 Tax=Rhizobium straminoryzae TaxID=1387186 RepID=A0A549TCY8_9HYPH|nr:hypothetical protein [Rhizobium straminoryzae]TRL39823.1 hypothetical protein FNA46_07765 [Rhizobium straminoryzae]